MPTKKSQFYDCFSENCITFVAETEKPPADSHWMSSQGLGWQRFTLMFFKSIKQWI